MAASSEVPVSALEIRFEHTPRIGSKVNLGWCQAVDTMRHRDGTMITPLLGAGCELQSPWPRGGVRSALGALAAAALLLQPFLVRPLHAEEAVPPARLTIASWDMSEAPDLEPQDKRPSKQRWRTTFGSERRTESPPAASRPMIDADAVLLQGVADLTALRRLFPARIWRLVVSRHMLWPLDGPRSSSPNDVTEVPATAIVVRYREGLRVVAQEHLDDLAAAGAGATEPPGPGATAACILDRGRKLWLLSVSLPASCSAGPHCPARDRLAKWQQEKRERGEPIFVGGRLVHGRRPLPQPPCADQSIETEGWQPPLRARGSVSDPRQDIGCIALLRLPN